jgi:hemerythrin-like domain-containing protein
MGPIEKLMDEHRNILKGISFLENGCNRLEKGDDIPVVFFSGMIDFIRNYADKYHHAKEEDILFIRMEKAGFPSGGGPIAVMLAEHVQGRAFVAGMEDACGKYADGDKSSAKEIIENGRGYIYLLRQHINKEDNILYPMAVNVLGESGINSMQADFDKVEKKKAGIEQKYIELLKRIESELGIDG